MPAPRCARAARAAGHNPSFLGASARPVLSERGCSERKEGAGTLQEPAPGAQKVARGACACTRAGSLHKECALSLPSGASLRTHMAAGAVAGIMEHTVMYPVDSVKTRMQSLQPDPKAQYRSVYEALKKIILTEGIWRPLRGINVTMLGAGPAHAMYFACYEKLKKTLSETIQHGGNSHLANGTLHKTPPKRGPSSGRSSC
uniref:Mitoferrin-1 n=1 Tax=Nothoprocta perdicaria TaxID=30464 RepID=A0A8C6ZNL9_NOTPE